MARSKSEGTCVQLTWLYLLSHRAGSMAHQFPYTRVTGVDIAPIPLREDQLPPNGEFEVDDIMMGLGHFANRFDIVHLRCLGGGLPDYNQGITYAAQCVKPGGMLLVIDFDLQLCAEDMVTTQKMATPNQRDGSWYQRYMYEVRCAFARNGTNDYKVIETLDRGLWDHPLLTNCGAANMFNPVGPWATSDEPEEAQRLKFAGIVLRQNIRSALRAYHTVMRKHGVSQEAIDKFTNAADEELDTLKVHHWIRLCLLWGIRKPLGQDQALGSVNRENEGEEGSAGAPLRSNWQPYWTIQLYHTQEESLAARKLRQDTIGELVEPQVSLVDEKRPS